MGIPLRVLLVEDSVADAELELVELRLGGYDPDYKRVDTPKEMTAALEEGEWDVILSDYVMPRFSGPAALKLVKESGLDVPVVMVTGQVGEATAIETLTAGAHDYVMKGNLARLVPAVQRVLQDAALRRERREAAAALRRAHEELRLAHAELERRVEERTAELAKANEELQSELGERKRAEAQLSRNQKTFSELVERAPFGIYVVDSQFRIAQMNVGSQTGAFRNVRPVIGRDFAEAMRILWPEPVAAEIIAVFHHTLETGEPYYSPRFTNPRQDVETVESYEWELHRMTLPDGQYGVICYYFDSTRLREAEGELRESEAKLRAVFRSLVEGVVFLNPQGDVEETNEAVERMHGHTLEELANPELDPRWRIIRPDGTPFPVDEQPAIVALRTGEAVRDVEMGVPTREGGLRWRLVNAQPVYDDYGNLLGVVASFFDITDRKQAEEALKASKERLRFALQAADLGTWDLDLINDVAVRSLRHDQI